MPQSVTTLISTLQRFCGSTVPPVVPTASCCQCGRIVDTRETKDGGDPFGCELSDGRWTCSFECWDAAIEPLKAPTREFPSTAKSPLENFRLGRLMWSFKTVDEQGRWWKIETRQCRSTGVIMRHTVRITD